MGADVDLLLQFLVLTWPAASLKHPLTIQGHEPQVDLANIFSRTDGRSLRINFLQRTRKFQTQRATFCTTRNFLEHVTRKTPSPPNSITEICPNQLCNAHLNARVGAVYGFRKRVVVIEHKLKWHSLLSALGLYYQYLLYMSAALEFGVATIATALSASIAAFVAAAADATGAAPFTCN